MGKTKPKAKPTDPSEIIVQYDLFALPTAFHKAGLAGLIMLIESLKARRILNEDDARYTVMPTTAEIALTEQLISTLFDDLYDAEPQPPKEKKTALGKSKKLIAVSNENKKAKEAPPAPKFAALKDLLPENDVLWIKLYRDMLFQTIRSQPLTWLPYKDRIAGKPYRKPKRDPWANAILWDRAQKAGKIAIESLAGSLLPGIQESSPERLVCKGRLDQNLLLHFWPLAVLVYCPQSIKAERENGQLRIATTFPGFALVVPDVANLTEFIDDFKLLLHSLKPDAAGYRPAQAVVDLPEEGALSLLDHLAQLTQQYFEVGELRFSVRCAEFLYLVKEKRNVKIMASGRVSPNKKLLEDYRQIIAPHDESTRYRNPIFRRGLLVALLRDEPWHQPFAQTIAKYDDELFIRQYRHNDDKDVKHLPQFANDVAKKFRHENKLLADLLKRSKSMPGVERSKPSLSIIVNRIVRNYLLTRTKEKTEIDPEKFRTAEGEIDYKMIPSDFNEAKQKLAQSLFLEFRSRKDQAFVDHFSATFFSVSQRIGETDRLELAEVMMNSDCSERREDLKTLTLLSLSANS